MADLFYGALALGLFALFGGFVAALRRIWPCSWTSYGRPGRSSSPATWSRRCCGPTNS